MALPKYFLSVQLGFEIEAETLTAALERCRDIPGFAAQLGGALSRAEAEPGLTKVDWDVRPMLTPRMPGRSTVPRHGALAYGSQGGPDDLPAAG